MTYAGRSIKNKHSKRHWIKPTRTVRLNKKPFILYKLLRKRKVKTENSWRLN